MAFLALIASRYVGFWFAGSDAILLTPSPVGLAADFLTAVLLLTFFRVLYGIPLWFVRPPIRNAGTYVLFTLVFGFLFTQRTHQAIGVRVEQTKVQVFYPFPSSSVFIPIGELSPPELRETPGVRSIEIPGSSVQFIPAFHFDSIGQTKLNSLFHALTTAKPVPPDPKPE